MRKLGLIAGNGVFPMEVAAAARRHGIRIIAVAHRGESRPELEPLCDEITWINVGEMQRIVDVLKAARVSEAAMAGGIARSRLSQSFKPDARALKMLSRIKRFSDDTVLRAVAGEIESEDIPVIDPVPLMDGALAGAGRQAGPELTPAYLNDMKLAFAVMSALGNFDIGQAVVVHQGVVAAIEAVEGTDQALRRAAALCGRGLVIAKAAKRSQDLRFDRPAIGPATIDTLAELGAAAIGVAASQALILERARTIELAEQKNVTIYGYGE
ncbi:MAG: LpxI family protein [Candidatus Binataceae bacterium]